MRWTPEARQGWAAPNRLALGTKETREFLILLDGTTSQPRKISDSRDNATFSDGTEQRNSQSQT